jgi:hypothetical protein
VKSAPLHPVTAPRILYWFVHPSTTPPTPLGFIRDNRNGALVIGGKTGSHYTGHRDTWWDKFREVVSLGYVPVEQAAAQHLVASDWTPPSLDDKDALIVRRIQNGEI